MYWRWGVYHLASGDSVEVDGMKFLAAEFGAVDRYTRFQIGDKFGAYLWHSQTGKVLTCTRTT